ncbi:unnamed protein product, partial [Rotaria sp. Silwood1]
TAAITHAFTFIGFELYATADDDDARKIRHWKS